MTITEYTVFDVMNLPRPAWRILPSEPLLAIKAQQLTLGEVPHPEMIEARYLGVGDYLALAKPSLREEQVAIKPDEVPLHKTAHYKDRLLPAELPINDDFGLVVGWYLGDGSITDQDCIEVCFHESEKAWVDRYCDAVERICGIRPRVTAKADRKAIRAMIYHKRLAALLIHYAGKGSRSKALHSDVFRWPRSALRALVVGYFAADGYARVVDGKYHYAAAASVSERLSHHLFWLMIGLGYHPALSVGHDMVPGGYLRLNLVGVYGDEARDLGSATKMNFRPVKRLVGQRGRVRWLDAHGYYLLPIVRCYRELSEESLSERRPVTWHFELSVA